jgi:hypothetical protein
MAIKDEPFEANLQVFKVQRPLMSTGSMTEILVYNEDRTIDSQTEIGPKAMKELFQEGEYKIFVRGKLWDDGRIYFHEILADRDWPEW